MNDVSMGWAAVTVGLIIVAGLGLIRGPQHRLLRSAEKPPDSRLDPRWWAGAGHSRPSEPAGRSASSSGTLARLFDAGAMVGARPDALRRSSRAMLAGLVAIAFGLLAPVLVVPIGAGAWAVGGAFGLTTYLLLGRMEPAASRRRSLQLILETPQALDLLAACLAAGLPLRAATVAVAREFPGPVRDDLDPVTAGIGLGVDDATAWRMLRRHPLLGRVAVDLARSVESGTMMVEVLEHHARDARRRRHAELEARAKKVGVRCVIPLMACFIPAFLCIGVVPSIASALMEILG